MRLMRWETATARYGYQRCATATASQSKSLTLDAVFHPIPWREFSIRFSALRDLEKVTVSAWQYLQLSPSHWAAPLRSNQRKEPGAAFVSGFRGAHLRTRPVALTTERWMASVT